MAFVVLVTVAVPYYVLRARAQWFFQDEWVFLVERDGGDLSDLFTPHGQHWSTLPILAYRVLWNLVGLHRYEPYQLLAVGAHLAVAVLLRVVMRRGGVGPWIATAAAGLFVLLGSGSQHIVWGFGVTFSASLALGIGHLLLADHDQRWGRRDLAGLACGLGSLMSSGVGITMLFVVGVATFLRRRTGDMPRSTPRRSRASTASGGTSWGATRGVLGRDAPTADVARFLVRGVSNLFAELGQVRLVGWLLFGVLLTGLALAAREGSAFLRGRGAAPIAMALGALVFLATTGRGRVEEYGVEFATASRYVHVTAALVLPAVGRSQPTRLGASLAVACPTRPRGPPRRRSGERADARDPDRAVAAPRARAGTRPGAGVGAAVPAPLRKIFASDGHQGVVTLRSAHQCGMAPRRGRRRTDP